MIKKIIISLDSKDIMSIPLNSGANLLHGQGIGILLDPSGILGVDKHSSSGKHTILFIPSSKGVSFVPLQILVHSLHIKVPGVAIFSGDEILTEYWSPFGTVDFGLELSLEIAAFLCEVHFATFGNVSFHFLEGFVESVVHGGRVQVEYSSYSFGVVATGGKSKFGTQSVTPESGGGNFILVHESNNITSLVFEIELFVSVGVSKISGTQKINISVF